MAKTRKEKYVPVNFVAVGDTYYYQIGNYYLPVKVLRNRIEVKCPSGLKTLVSINDLYQEVK